MGTLKAKLLRFLTEDSPDGDITTEAICTSPGEVTSARIHAKQNGIFSGSAVLHQWAEIFPDVSIVYCLKDGQPFKNKTRIAELRGPIKKILLIERITLNLIMHLSGIATQTKSFVDKLNGTRAILLDTRKTMPGLRDLEKSAVTHGGGHNHRRDLSDGYLIKENHIHSAGGIGIALAKARSHRRKKHQKKMLIVETTNLAELKAALPFQPDVILLDNMTPAQIKNSVRIRNSYLKANNLAITPPLIQLEVSGGINIKNIRKVAQLGVDRISVGALTHSVPAIDMSLLLLS